MVGSMRTGKFARGLASVAMALVVASALALAAPASALAAGQAGYQAAAVHTQSSAKSAKKTTKNKAAFSMKRYKTVKRNAYVTGKYSYAKPVVKGSSKAVKAINKSLEKARKKTLQQKKSILAYAQHADRAYSGSTYYYTVGAKCTLNSGGKVAFTHTHKWWAGGVYESWKTSQTYSLKTGKLLKSSNRKVTTY